MSVRLAAGTMTGTSIDSLDAALVRLEGRGLDMTANFVRGASRPLDSLRPRLRMLAEQRPVSIGEVAQLAREFSLLHVEVLRELLGGDRADLVCLHGQTVYHKPPVSHQLMNAAVVAHALGIPVISDLRSADLACGGQGAPITPLADWILYGRPDPLDVVNLGGFCNITHLPARRGDDPRRAIRGIRGRDVCVCNQLLDTIARETLGLPFDRNGDAACRGTVDREAKERLSGLLQRQSGAGRSLGTGDELHNWITTYRRDLEPATLAATACEALGSLIAGATEAGLVVIAGGGVHNRGLAAAIRRHAKGDVLRSDDWGVPSQFREAAEFAILGALSHDRVPITLPQVTGVREPAPVSGIWIHP
jgi:anhydro-N-acetylmuramic acid kinase